MRKKLTMIMGLLVCTLLFGCGKQNAFLPNYNQLLNTYSHYFRYENLPSVTGFTPLVSLQFDYVSPFLGKYTFVKYAGEGYIFNAKDKSLTKAEKDLVGKTIEYGYYIEQQERGKMLMNLNGTTAINEIYDEISIIEDTILCVSGRDYFVYMHNLNICSGTFKESARLYDAQYLKIDGALYSTSGNPILILGHPAIDKGEEGVFTVMDSSTHLMGYATDSAWLSKLKFQVATPFSGGMAVGTAYSKNQVINYSGQVVYESNETIHPFYDGYAIMEKDGKISILNASDFSKTPFIINNIAFKRVFGNHLITKDPTDFYSLKSSEFLNCAFTRITPLQDYFVVYSSKQTVRLLDRNLNTVIKEAHAITLHEGILVVMQEGKYLLYSRENTK